MKWYGIKNFYSFIVNRQKLGDIHWWLLFSLAKTLAKKYKLTSEAQVFKKFKKLLKDSKTEIQLFNFLKKELF